MKKLSIAALCLLTAALCFTGCSTLGNGKIDVPVDVDLVFHDNFGNGFTLIHGQLEEATYRSVKTGVLYEYTTDTGKGTFHVTEPRTGAIIRLRLKEGAGNLKPETGNLSETGNQSETGNWKLETGSTGVAPTHLNQASPPNDQASANTHRQTAS